MITLLITGCYLGKTRKNLTALSKTARVLISSTFLLETFAALAIVALGYLIRTNNLPFFKTLQGRMELVAPFMLGAGAYALLPTIGLAGLICCQKTAN